MEIQDLSSSVASEDGNGGTISFEELIGHDYRKIHSYFDPSPPLLCEVSPVKVIPGIFLDPAVFRRLVHDPGYDNIPVMLPYFHNPSLRHSRISGTRQLGHFLSRHEYRNGKHYG
jgi:hypothetical protein